RLSKEQGYTFVPPFDHPLVIAGQGTIGMEMLQQNGHLDYIFVPVGGGGLAAGVAVLALSVLIWASSGWIQGAMLLPLFKWLSAEYIPELGYFDPF
ncbi:pyridoxal-phosphate dependent enzyme, partial [Vibrio cholerae]|uniref:pyridoxal-phosphate dependent enzyme n=1 Tax=Vibrio cholerae TaxID=666 RepID=UPI001125048D